MNDALDFTACVRLPVRDPTGRPLGAIADVEVKASERFPRVVGLRVERRGEVSRVPWERVERLDAGGAVVHEGRGGEQFPYDGRILRLGRDVLDAQVVDLAGKRLARVGDVVLARQGRELRAVAVDAGRTVRRRSRRHRHVLHPRRRLRIPIAVGARALDGRAGPIPRARRPHGRRHRAGNGGTHPRALRSPRRHAGPARARRRERRCRWTATRS